MSYDSLIKLANDEGCLVYKDEPLSRYTSFKIGGNADLFIDITSKQALKKIIKHIYNNKINYYIIGNGSNLLVRDEGFRGVILRLNGEFLQIELQGDETVVCGAAAKLSKLCSFVLQNGLSGAEFLWGIPGSAGGAAFMNAGAFDGEMKDILLFCEHITPQGEEEEIQNANMELGYRTSIYMKNKNIITSLKFKLNKQKIDKIKLKMDELLQKRKEKQPLGYPNAGSIFKRPVNNYAGTLISSCGLSGRKIGGAQVSTKHAGFIINLGGASSKDVTALMKLIQDEVYKQKGVMLEPEVILL